MIRKVQSPSIHVFIFKYMADTGGPQSLSVTSLNENNTAE